MNKIANDLKEYFEDNYLNIDVIVHSDDTINWEGDEESLSLFNKFCKENDLTANVEQCGDTFFALIWL